MRVNRNLLQGLALLLLLTLVCAGSVNVYQSAQIYESLQERNDMTQTLKDEWVSGKVTKTVTTERGERESAEDFERRHQEVVDLRMKSCPPD